MLESILYLYQTRVYIVSKIHSHTQIGLPGAIGWWREGAGGTHTLTLSSASPPRSQPAHAVQLLFLSFKTTSITTNTKLIHFFRGFVLWHHFVKPQNHKINQFWKKKKDFEVIKKVYIRLTSTLKNMKKLLNGSYFHEFSSFSFFSTISVLQVTNYFWDLSPPD